MCNISIAPAGASTNSVTHAGVGVDQVLFLELASVEGHLRLAVSDPGSALEPRVPAADPGVAGGFGLRLVATMCSAWGFDRDVGGHTRF